jgi:mono/diheme cytochrome c family protein
LAPRPALAAFDAAVAFDARCSTCHSVGRGVVVGPDLRGVSARHDGRWLRSFIRSSQSVIRSGDASAVALFRKFQRVMPDHPLSDPEIDAVLAYIEAGGPASRPSVGLRSADSATPREVAHGRDLFLGRVAFTNGGAACVHCHTAGAAHLLGGGSLASDLSRVSERYQDWGMHRALQHEDFPLMRRIYSGRALTEDEVFAVKAFLARAPRESPVPRERVPLPMAFIGLGSSALVLLTARRGAGRVESADSEG